jgi:ATP-dependent exoDNAse (exonuclease V) alpha subunit
METAELIQKMRARVEQARRLAKYINDPRTTDALLRMAEEGETDIRKLEEEGRRSQHEA